MDSLHHYRKYIDNIRAYYINVIKRLFCNDLEVYNESLLNDLTVTGNTTLGTTVIEGTTTINYPVTVNANTLITGTASVEEDVIVEGDLSVDGGGVITSYLQYRSCCFRAEKAGSWTKNTNVSILDGVSATFDNSPSISGGWNSSLGIYEAPWTGYYSITFSCRAANQATVGFVPQTYDSATITRTYHIGNDLTLWVHDDANLRRMACFTIVVYLRGGRDYFLCSPYAADDNWLWAQMSGHFIGT